MLALQGLHEMRIVFLDIDGVLNIMDDGQKHVEYSPEKFPTSQRHAFLELNKDCVAMLNVITRATEAKIVVSSTWRQGSEAVFEVLKHHLKSEGVEAEVIGRTPSGRSDVPEEIWDGFEYPQRGHEIQCWLNNCQDPISSFIILDDDSDMAHLSKYLLNTDTFEGLTSAYPLPAVLMLMNPELVKLDDHERALRLHMYQCPRCKDYTLRRRCRRQATQNVERCNDIPQIIYERYGALTLNPDSYTFPKAEFEKA